MVNLKIDNELRVRLKTAFNALKATGEAATVADFAEKLGYTSRISVSQILNGTVAVPKMFAERVLECYPCLSKRYLLEGVGAVMEADNISEYQDEREEGENIAYLKSIIKDYQDKLESKDRQIDRLLGIVENKQSESK